MIMTSELIKEDAFESNGSRNVFQPSRIIEKEISWLGKIFKRHCQVEMQIIILLKDYVNL